MFLNIYVLTSHMYEAEVINLGKTKKKMYFLFSLIFRAYNSTNTLLFPFLFPHISPLRRPSIQSFHIYIHVAVCMYIAFAFSATLFEFFPHSLSLSLSVGVVVARMQVQALNRKLCKLIPAQLLFGIFFSCF